MRRAGCVVALAAALLVHGCKCRSQPAAGDGAQPSASASASTPAPVVLPPLSAESWRIDLAVPGYEPASVALPLGAREPRPVIIALHGIADRAEWQCGTWTGISKARAFVLCPRGIRRKDGNETFGNVARTESELRAALAALKKRFGAHVAAGPVVLAGYSLGASHAVHVLKQEPAFFSRVVLIEGGHSEITPTIAGVFAKGGGKRVLFACGQSACERAAERSALFVRRAGADAELVMVPGVGHALESRMAKAIGEKFGWLVAGDARFASGAKP